MNQAKVSVRNKKTGESVMNQMTGFGQKVTKSSCGCGGDNQKINIERNKIMNESNERMNKTTTVTAPEIVCGG